MKKFKMFKIIFGMFIFCLGSYSSLFAGQLVTQKNIEVFAGASQAQGDTVRFAVVGDRTGGERKGVFESLVKKMNLLSPDFIVSVGDNIHGCTEDIAKITAQWDKCESEIGKLNMPFIAAAGNHDLTNNVMLDLYQKRFGNPYYYFVRNDMLFLFIDTEDPPVKLPGDLRSVMNKEAREIRKNIKKDGYTDENIAAYLDYDRRMLNLDCAVISDEQVQYFEKVLGENKDVSWTFVVMHKRAWDVDNISKNWLKIESLLKDRPYTVFGGHMHSYDYRVRNGNDYIGLATVGGGWMFPPELRPGIYDHVLMVTVQENKVPIIANIILGTVFDKTDIVSVDCEKCVVDKEK